MLVLGIDEVGRGCLAGPLVVGAVVLDDDIEGVKDSKLLSAKQRLYYDKIIRQTAKFIGLGWVDAIELDAIGLIKGLELAALRSLDHLQLKVDQTIIDGNVDFLKGKFNATTMIKADNLICAVSAASIVAKVARDEYMINIAKKFPGYGFHTNVGYGTKEHLQAIKSYGVCSLHRRSFEPIKSFVTV